MPAHEHAAPIALPACLDEFLAEVPATPGIVARVEHPDGHGWTSARGVADLRTRRAMREDATFRIASNTKTLCAAAVLRLTESGALAIEDSVANFLPRDLVQRLCVIDGVSHGHRITIRDLLQHTSGIHGSSSRGLMALVVEQPAKRWTPLEKVEWMLDAGPSSFPPGDAVEYSDTGYVLLAVIVETVFARPFAASLRLLLRFSELGLNVVHLESLEPTPARAGPRARQYLDDIDTTDFDPSFDLWGGGGLVSDVADLAGFWRALFEHRVFDSPATLARMCNTTGRPASTDGTGLGLFQRRIGGRPVWSHTGFWGTSALHDPASGVTVATAANQAGYPESAALRLQERLLTIADDPRGRDPHASLPRPRLEERRPR